jgi:hypothetical protein
VHVIANKIMNKNVTKIIVLETFIPAGTSSGTVQNLP